MVSSARLLNLEQVDLLGQCDDGSITGAPSPDQEGVVTGVGQMHHGKRRIRGLELLNMQPWFPFFDL